MIHSKYVTRLLLALVITGLTQTGVTAQQDLGIWPSANVPSPPPPAPDQLDADKPVASYPAAPAPAAQTAVGRAGTCASGRCVGSCEGNCFGEPTKFFRGVDQFQCRGFDREPTWQDERMIPWEAFAYGEYVGPHRTPHVPQYRTRVNDEIEFVYQLTREQTTEPYRILIGDLIAITSATDAELNQTDISILSDGSISLRLIGRVMAAGKTLEELQTELNERYGKFFQADPSIVVQGIKTDTRLEDLRDAVDARSGLGGQNQVVRVAPDGTIQLPMIGSSPAVGLTLSELEREVNMRYRAHFKGIEVTPILTNRAPRFIFVLGEVAQPGRVQLEGPTSAMQAIALAGGWNAGGNLRQIIVFRRDHDWRLMAVRLDLAGGLWGKRPHPADEIWLRDSDIVLVPKLPIQRIADAVDLYFTRTVYGLYPPLLDNTRF